MINRKSLNKHILWLQRRIFCNFHLTFELFLTCTYILLLINASVVPWKSCKTYISRDLNRIHTRQRLQRDWLLPFMTFTLMDRPEGKGVLALLLWRVFTWCNDHQQVYVEYIKLNKCWNQHSNKTFVQYASCK